ncbi:sialic acid-binding Ig-like lectin 13 [Rhineura floridana]|uniref:sialic acid-binding Ig-like lectin 13 n=1 Tax=Rhineura floridana TaxID=261503 RepID=UPI002AC83852|nr:sialic acid-binding Ig-like lectin 13 [Rhineura floridana]XP_061452060.1 sialic acid-binding Ig-like lectin 13 [Rhineura floridana]XP_061452061.1 sialic acid-binding Ig-like lectin 13 [Rhineura floridana]
MRCPLEVLILGLVSTCLLWEGVQCKTSEFTLMVPKEVVSVHERLCVVIPCSFTYRSLMDTDELHGYWYRKGRNPSWHDPAVATTDGKRAIEDFAHNRFSLLGDLEKENCSLMIIDAQQIDQGEYFFRMEKGYLKYSYPETISVEVTGSRNPKIQIPGKLQAERPVNITCTAPLSCFQKPNITWAGISGSITSRIHVLPRNIKLRSTFTPSAEDDGQQLTCIAKYDSGTNPVQMEKSLQLNISYPPQMLRFSGELRHSNGSRRNFTNASRIEAQEGDCIKLHCKADGNPSANVTWVKESQHSGTLQLTSDNTLKLSNVKLENKGRYRCQAQNTEGSAEATFRIYLAYSPRPCEQDPSHCWREDNSFRCNCSICSYPAPRIQWQVDGESLEGNTTKGKWRVTSWNEEEVAASTLHLTGSWDGEHPVVCQGTNPSGELPMKFFLFSSGAHYEPLHVGTTVALVLALYLTKALLCLFLFSFSFWYLNYWKPSVTRESPSKSEG